MNNKDFGKSGEKAAAAEYINNGYTVIQTNFRLKRYGEIDIICTDGKVICFVEVKTRSNDKYGEPQEAVDRRKQSKIKFVARGFLSLITNRKYAALQPRFDVCSVYMSRDINAMPRISIIENAF